MLIVHHFSLLDAKIHVMKVKIKRFDKSLPLPDYQSPGAVAFDLYARLATTVPAQTVGYIPLNVSIEIPAGHFALMAARSSLHKRGLMAANGIGVFDLDFRGDEDEYVFAAYNFTKKPVIIEKGERIAQLLFIKTDRIEIEEVKKMGHPTRGGFGSTGTK